MSNIKIGHVSGDNNVFGDNNTVTNGAVSNQLIDRVLTRDEYFQIMLEIRELERVSLGDYLEDKLQKMLPKNPDFVKILYKDICKVLEGVHGEGDNDLLIENGDFVIEYGDIKLTGHPTNLDYALTWLHIKLLEGFITENPYDLLVKMERFENDFLNIDYNTPAYTQKLSGLRDSLTKERRSKNKSGLRWTDLNEMIQLKPNIAGIGLDLNAVLSKIFRRRKS